MNDRYIATLAAVAAMMALLGIGQCSMEMQSRQLEFEQAQADRGLCRYKDSFWLPFAWSKCR